MTCSSLRAALAAALLLCTACSDDGDGDFAEPSRGELGFAIFQWGCTSIDEFDVSSCEEIDFPREIVLGGTFQATFRLRSGLPDRIDARGLESGSPSFLSGDAGQFTAIRTGRVALLALGEDSVIDYTNLRIYQAERVAVAAASSQPPCTTADCGTTVFEGGAFVLYPGAQVRVEAIPFAGALRLWGRLDWAWASASPDLLAVTSEPGGTAILQPIAPGTATVEVTGGGITSTVALVIQESAPPPPSTTGDTDDGTASGDTGGGSGSSDGTATGDASGGSDGTGEGSGSGSDTAAESSGGSSSTGGAT